MAPDNDKGIAEWRSVVRATLKGDARSYEELQKLASTMKQVFQEELASAIGPSLGERVANAPQETLSQRRDLASWCNRELKELGLAIRCPRTSRPAIIISDAREGPSGRYRLQVRDDNGVIYRSWTSDNPRLGRFELMPDSPRREPFAGRPGHAR